MRQCREVKAKELWGERRTLTDLQSGRPGWEASPPLRHRCSQHSRPDPRVPLVPSRWALSLATLCQPTSASLSLHSRDSPVPPRLSPQEWEAEALVPPFRRQAHPGELELPICPQPCVGSGQGRQTQCHTRLVSAPGAASRRVTLIRRKRVQSGREAYIATMRRVQLPLKLDIRAVPHPHTRPQTRRETSAARSRKRHLKGPQF